MSCSYYTFRQGDYYCTKKSDYVNEDVYYKYCRNWDYSDCPVYKGDTSGGCYLTSACMYSKGLPDDCYELETLRNFRDTWLKNQGDPSRIVSLMDKINPNALLIGFGRRFATYKRAHLLFTDLNVCLRL